MKNKKIGNGKFETYTRYFGRLKTETTTEPHQHSCFRNLARDHQIPAEPTRGSNTDLLKVNFLVNAGYTYITALTSDLT